MRRILWAGLLALPMTLATTETASAQGCATGGCPTAGVWGAPRSNPFGCGLFCFRMYAGLHQEGPLVNYGPYSGYYPFEPYGPWTSDLRYNPPQMACNHCGGGHGFGLGWGHYAVSTLKNVFHRVNPLANRCGGGLSLGHCGSIGSSCGGSSGCAGSAAPCGGCSAAVTVSQPQVQVQLPATIPGPTLPIYAERVPAVLTGQTK